MKNIKTLIIIFLIFSIFFIIIKNKNTNIKDIAIIAPICPLDSFSCNEVPDQAYPISDGSVLSDISSIVLIALPELIFPLALPFIVIAGYILNLVLIYGPTILFVFITEVRGTICPFLFLTNIFFKSDNCSLYSESACK